MTYNPPIEKVLQGLRSGKIIGETKITMECLDAIASSTVYMKAKRPEDFEHEITEYLALFLKERPRLILLANASRYLINEVRQGIDKGLSVTELKKLVTLKAMEFNKSMRSAIDKIGEVGARYIEDGDVILTHGASTTVLSILAKAKEEGKKIQVMVTEARPDFQGRILAMALADLGLPTTLIIDSAHYYYIRRVHKVVLGATAICPNGCIVGKVGTGAVALAAREHRVKVYVAANTQKITAEVAFAEEASYERGDPSWVLPQEEIQRLGIFVANPTYDVTPPEYIDLIITEKGAVPPQGVILIAKEIYGWPLVTFKHTDFFEYIT
ncbi:MAG: ribose 1,5-bisphosphate isomerase [Thermoprotei archaeon]|nr:MAG: ribose 1,5-bisphosphate isomerase [Thermoprotei archaeon]RLF18821.1 MAG: ribose 1,5-bisphosphate isomerase [Thermoprotei archaeon]